MSKSISIVLAVVVGLGAGYWLGRGSGADNYKVKYEQLRDKLDHLNKVDFEEYLALKSQKDKYEKADEILGKMILIFLADLGFSISDDKMKLARRMAGPDAGAMGAQGADSPAASRMETSEGTGGPDSAGSNAGTSGAGKGAPTSDKVAQLSLKEKGVDELANETQAKEFLDSVALDELFDQIKSAKRLTPGQFEAVRGTYTGKLQFDDTRENPWDVEIQLEGTPEGESINGAVDIKMFKQGSAKPFSHARGKGNDLKNVQGFPGDSQAILMNVYGDDGYLQVYAPKRLGYLIANYYHKKDITSFKKTGTATLYRR